MTSPIRRLLLLAALTLTACGDQTVTGPGRLCANPAPLRGQANPRAPGYIVVYQDGTPASETTEQLARKYGFAPRHVYTVFPGFAADLTTDALAGVRCESVVRYVEHNGEVSLSRQAP